MTEKNLHESTEATLDEQNITETELEENQAVEQAYQVEIQTELPDLWNRIEAALPDQTTPAAESKLKKMISFKNYRTFMLIAACVLVALMVPTLLSVGGRKTESAAASEDTVMEDAAAAEEAPAEEMSAEAEMPADDAYMTEAVAEEAAPAETAGAASDEAVTGTSAENSIETEAIKADLSTNRDEKQQQTTERNDYGSDALYTEAVEVEIIECDTELGRLDDDGYCTYTVMILKDVTGLYEEASTMDVYVDETEAKGIKVGDKLTVTLVNPDPLSSAVPHISMLLTD